MLDKIPSADADICDVRAGVVGPEGVEHDNFAAVSVAVYLAVGLLFWVAALPQFLSAQDGYTAGASEIDGAPPVCRLRNPGTRAVRR